MRSRISRDIQRRNRYKKKYRFNVLLKHYLQNNIDKKHKVTCLNIFWHNKNKIPKTKLHNRCAYRGRPRSANFKYKIARQTFRKFAQIGAVSGVYRKTW